MNRILSRIIDICAVPGRAAGWLILPLILFVCLAVFAAQTGRNAFADWDGEVFLLGGGVTVNTLLDLQWHIFALLVLFGGAFAFRDGAHVSVDFLSVTLPARLQTILRILGDALLLVPFCAIMAWYGWSFAETAYVSGEGSSYGGLEDRWLIKAAVPVGFALLGIAGFARALRDVLRLMRGEAQEPAQR